MAKNIPAWERNDNFRSHFYERLHEHAQELEDLKGKLPDKLEEGFTHFEDTLYPVVPFEGHYVPPDTPSVGQRRSWGFQRATTWLMLLDIHGRENVWIGPPLTEETAIGLQPEELRAFYIKGLPDFSKELEVPLENRVPTVKTS